MGTLSVWLFILHLLGIAREFAMPTASMQPTIMIGDVFSMPMVRLYGAGPRLLTTDPQQGDIIVFWNAPTGELYTKRVIGTAGDHIMMRDGRLVINGTIVPREAEGTFDDTDSLGTTIPVTRYRETLPNGVEHDIYEVSDDQMLDNTAEMIVPAGTVFTLGDNRDRSADSRVLSQVGYVAIANVRGIALAKEPLVFAYKAHR